MKEKKIIDKLASDLFVNNPVDKSLNEVIDDLMSESPTEKDRQDWLNNRYGKKK